MVIRHQVALGRLKSLTFACFLGRAGDVKGPGMLHLMAFVLSIGGLEHLDFFVCPFDILGQSSAANEITVAANWIPQQVRPASLKRLQVFAHRGYQPHVEYLLQTHAATLEELDLMSFSGRLPVALLAAAVQLRKLECPIADDMSLLLGCEHLRSVSLQVFRGTSPAALRSAWAFLRGAAQRLREVTLRFEDDQHRDIALVRALAVPGGALEELHVGFEEDESLTGQLIPHLLAALPHLQWLRVLKLPYQPAGDILRALTPATAPCLELLAMQPPTPCVHKWVHHQPEVRDVLLRNPQLHIEVEAQHCHGCGLCLRGCHSDLASALLPPGDYHCLCFFGHPEGERCGVCRAHSADARFNV